MGVIECLFCKHPNPAGASFCNDCGSSLDVQLCDRCGAIDKRTAHNCYKCGAAFPLSATSEVAADSVADESDSARTALGQQSTAAAMTLAGTSHARPILPESVPQALAVWRRRSQHSGNHSRKPAPAIAVAESPRARREQAPPAEPTSVNERMARPATGSRTAASRPAWWLALAVVLLVAIAAAVYYYHQRSAQVAETPGAPPLSTAVSGSPAAAGGGPTPAAPKEAAGAAASGTLPAGTTGAEQGPSPATAGAAEPGRPKPALDAASNARSQPAMARECPEAVAALGLCNANVKQGRQ